jgi:hypothetical protein
MQMSVDLCGLSFINPATEILPKLIGRWASQFRYRFYGLSRWHGRNPRVASLQHLMTNCDSDYQNVVRVTAFFSQAFQDRPEIALARHEASGVEFSTE